MKYVLRKTYQCGCRVRIGKVGRIIFSHTDINRVYQYSASYHALNNKAGCKCQTEIVEVEE